MESPYALIIYTDGSCLPSPRRGGVGVRFVFPDDFEIDNLIWDFEYAGYKNTTNNEMELKACILAIEEVLKAYNTIKPLPRVLIHTDSIDVQGNYIRALTTWPKNKWRNGHGKPLANTILWKEFCKSFNKLKYEVISPNSKYYPNVDFIYYEHPLKAGHCYFVSVNKNNKYPKISKIYHEIKNEN